MEIELLRLMHHRVPGPCLELVGGETLLRDGVADDRRDLHGVPRDDEASPGEQARETFEADLTALGRRCREQQCEHVARVPDEVHFATVGLDQRDDLRQQLVPSASTVPCLERRQLVQLQHREHARTPTPIDTLELMLDLRVERLFGQRTGEAGNQSVTWDGRPVEARSDASDELLRLLLPADDVVGALPEGIEREPGRSVLCDDDDRRQLPTVEPPNQFDQVERPAALVRHRNVDQDEVRQYRRKLPARLLQRAGCDRRPAPRGHRLSELPPTRPIRGGDEDHLPQPGLGVRVREKAKTGDRERAHPA